MGILSVIINAWPGTDLFRFRLQLETLIYRSERKEDYFKLAVDLLGGWEKNKWKVPGDKFKKQLLSHHFHMEKFEPNSVEVILAFDSTTSDSPVVDEFHDWAKNYNCQDRVRVIAEKRGISGMRNLAIAESKGDYVVFRDDDDFSTSITALQRQCASLELMNFGKNGDYTFPRFRYNHVREYRDAVLRLQKYPTIAILEDSIRIKNTWGTVDNPFSVTPTPVDASTIELVNRPSPTSMCSKIFSRESLRFIRNSESCSTLEDARTHYLQVMVQHCIWLFSKERLAEIDNWIENGQQRTATSHWLKQNVGEYGDRSKYFVSQCSPSFSYVLAGGSHATNSWSYCTVIAALEALRYSGRNIDFTIKDLKKMKEIICYGIKTKLVDTNCVTRVTSLSPTVIPKRLAELFEKLNNYRYLFWFAVVHKTEDWKMIMSTLSEIRKLVVKIKLPTELPMKDADVVKDTPIHPDHLPDTTNYTSWASITGGSIPVRSNPLVYLLLILILMTTVIASVVLIDDKPVFMINSTARQAVLTDFTS